MCVQSQVLLLARNLHYISGVLEVKRSRNIFIQGETVPGIQRQMHNCVQLPQSVYKGGSGNLKQDSRVPGDRSHVPLSCEFDQLVETPDQGIRLNQQR